MTSIIDFIQGVNVKFNLQEYLLKISLESSDWAFSLFLLNYFSLPFWKRMFSRNPAEMIWKSAMKIQQLLCSAYSNLYHLNFSYTDLSHATGTAARDVADSRPMPFCLILSGFFLAVLYFSLLAFHPSAFAADYFMPEQDKLATADIDAFDPYGNLNWSSRPPYNSTWTGIMWGTVDSSGFDRVYEISVDGKDLTGSLILSGFEYLTQITANENELARLQVDKDPALYHLEVWGNQLSSLDVDDNSNLEYLDVSYNFLVALNVKNNPVLDVLNAGFNNLVAVDLSGNPVLRDLDLTYNYLMYLDLRNNRLLQFLDVSSNYLDSLDVGNSPDLLFLEAMGNYIASLDVSNNPSLTFLDVSFNELDTLGVSRNPDLQHLNVGNNYLSSLDVSNNPNLEELDVSVNWLDSLDVSMNPNLKSLSVWGNYLMSLDVGSNPLLEYLDMNINYVTSLDLTNNLNLKELRASLNELEELFLGTNNILEYLDVSNNFYLTSLDVDSQSSLKFLDVSGNSLGSIEVGANTSLEHLDVSGNYLGSIDVGLNTSLEHLDVSGNYLSSIDVGTNTSLKHLDVRDNSIGSLNLSTNTSLEYLNVRNTSLDSIDVGANTSLKHMDVSDNSIYSLDVSANTSLEYLDVSDNSIGSLDVSANTSLKHLDVGDNSLNSLNLDDNPYLQYLDVSHNDLLSLNAENKGYLQYLDVSGNTNLTSLSVKNSGLSSLDLSDIPSLLALDVSGNKFPLSVLYDMMSVQNLNIGGQFDVDLDAVTSYTEPGIGYDIAPEAKINGVPTEFTVEVNGDAAVSGTDYAISPEGILTFMERGKFQITMKNPEVRNTGVYASRHATAATSLIDVLPAGALIVWAGNASASWAPEGSAASAKDWLYDGYGVRYLEGDDVDFGASALKHVVVDASGVNPWTMTVEDGGYSFSGGRIEGVMLVLEAAGCSSTRFSNEMSFTYGAEVLEGNTLVFDYGASAFPAGVVSGLSIVGDGAVSKDGDGELTFSRPNAYAGATSVLAGTLRLASGADVSRSLAGGGLVLYSGATFDVSSYGTLAIPRLAVHGGALPAVIVTGMGNAADFRGADLAWSLPQSLQDVSSMLRVNGEARIDAETGFSISDARPRLGMAAGEALVLLAADSLDAGAFVSRQVSTPAGDVFHIMIDPAAPGSILAVLASLSPLVPSYERMKAYPEAAAAALAFTGQGQDLLAGEGVSSVVTAASGQAGGRGAFGAAEGGSSRYRTGSSADVSGLSVLAGAALGAELGAGRLSFGIFAEAGRGDYDSHNSFAGSRKVDGRGDVSYAGGGVLARWDALGGALRGLYLEASARLGSQETDFDTGDILYGGSRASFKISGRYWGFHGGLGRAWKPGGQDGAVTLDLGARVLWTRQEGSDFRVDADRVRFEDADSLRVRAGGRLAFGAGGRAAPFLGAYFEREFDGALRASVNGISLETPSLRGNTGIFELGVAFRPTEAAPLVLEIGARGYAGKRQGFSGTAMLKYGF
ncbi:MAG: hypothetical protein LBQ79_08065 [Deltaproteobacteria bacterium]|nr:hypothetical protein [Deltaproteobacteria bacterium]